MEKILQLYGFSFPTSLSFYNEKQVDVLSLYGIEVSFLHFFSSKTSYTVLIRYQGLSFRKFSFTYLLITFQPAIINDGLLQLFNKARNFH